VPKTKQEKQAEAMLLIELAGLTQKEVGVRLKVSERTVSNWAKKFDWLSPKQVENKTKQEEARTLVLVEGYTQKEAAEKLGVSQPLIGIWAKKFGWKPETCFVYPTKQQRRYVLRNFVKMVQETNPDLVELLQSYVDKYNNQLEHKALSHG
jgi:transposase